MNKKYEIMTISKVDLGESAAKEVVENVQSHVESLDGKVESAKPWGKRAFAYPIAHDTEGFYDVLEFSLEKGNLEALKSKLNLTEGLVRYLISALE